MYSRIKSGNMKKIAIIFITAAVALCMLGIGTVNVNAATKPSKIYLGTAGNYKYVDYGAKLKVYVTKCKPSKASKKVRWSFARTAYKKYASLTNAASTYVNVYGKKSGTVKVKAVSRYNKRAVAYKTVYVRNMKAKAIKLSAAKLTIDMASPTAVLKATVTKPQAYGYKSQATTWKSGNTAIAAVSSNGTITAKAPGTVKITATNDGKSAVCTVQVNKAAGTGISGEYMIPDNVSKAMLKTNINGSPQNIYFTSGDIANFFGTGSANVNIWDGNDVNTNFAASSFSYKTDSGYYEITKTGNEVKVVNKGAITYWYVRNDAAEKSIKVTDASNYTITLYSTKTGVSSNAKTLKMDNGVISLAVNGKTYTASKSSTGDTVTLTQSGDKVLSITNSKSESSYLFDFVDSWETSHNVSMYISGQ